MLHSKELNLLVSQKYRAHLPVSRAVLLFASHKFVLYAWTSLEILSIQRVREFSILIPDCIDSKESVLPFPWSIL